MICGEFENNLTDYLDGSLDADSSRAFREHALRCPVCNELLGEVRRAIAACQTSEVTPPPLNIETKILMQTVPEAAMTCSEFEEHLTDYLDGFLPAPLYHRWERHAVACSECTDLPGDVVRSIGACYTYIDEELPVPATLNERILQATLGTIRAEAVRAPLAARIATRLRFLLDPIVSPQLATVATMLLVSVLVLTSTVSSDGSIGGMYRAGLKLAEQTYVNGASSAARGSLNEDLRQFAERISGIIRERRSSEREKDSKEAEGDSNNK